jgi:hypothetical protein
LLRIPSGFYRGNASEEQLKAEIVVALTLNQLANNSHKAENDPSTYFTVYNGNKIVSVKVVTHPLQTLTYMHSHTDRVIITQLANM